jgi:hypothetical protein
MVPQHTAYERQMASVEADAALAKQDASSPI